MDHDRYGIDGLPINAKGVDCDPVTGEILSNEPTGSFAFEPYTIALVILSIGFLILMAFEACLIK